MKMGMNLLSVVCRPQVHKKSREMTGRAKHCGVVAGGRRDKDDRKQNRLAPLVSLFKDHADMTTHRRIEDNLKQQT